VSLGREAQRDGVADGPGIVGMGDTFTGTPQIRCGGVVGCGDAAGAGDAVVRASGGGGGGSTVSGTTLQPDPVVLQLASNATAMNDSMTKRASIVHLPARMLRDGVRALLWTAGMLAMPLGPSSMPTLGPGAIVIAAPHGPLLPGARFPLQANGVAPPRFSLVGPGRLDGAAYVAPAALAAPAKATIVAATHDAVGSVTFALAPWPQGDLFAVATYDDGIAVHRAGDGALVGLLPLDGGVAAVARSGDAMLAPAAHAALLWRIDVHSGASTSVAGVPTGNEVDSYRGDAFVTNRDIDGSGALTRVRGDAVARVVTGDTAEGLAIDAARGLGYVTNVNSRDVAEIDLATLRVLRRMPVAERPFGIALDAENRRIDVVSNVPRSPTHEGGLVLALGADGHIVARSAHMSFPLGVALDAPRRRLFVTDEADGIVAVLDARTLRPQHPALHACAIPWLPTLDERSRRLYVPCAGANEVAVYDLGTLAQIKGSPYRTGGYPLGVATLHADADAASRPEAAP
jgi:YVTN family beta-propeller protein